MSLILHLTDLHLGKLDPEMDDHKADVVPLNERETRQKTLRRTLGGLRDLLKNGNEKLDAVFVTGDISYQNDKSGFALLEEVLGELKDSLPSHGRIAVVPGNHDVKPETSSTSPERYADFKAYVRDRGFVTPFIEGIDAPTETVADALLEQHCVIDIENSWFAIPINSANYCHVVERIDPIPEDEWNNFSKAVSKLDPNVFDPKKVSKALRSLRVHDMARISVEQFEYLERLIAAVETRISKQNRDPKSFTRIGLVHHHLLPVSTVEEAKKYESITNLGLFRQFLAFHRFDLLLHGHKHVGKVYWDFIPLARTSPEASVHQMLVVSGGTLGGPSGATEEVCRLIRINANVNAREISVSKIAAITPGISLSALGRENFSLWDRQSAAAAHHSVLKRIVGTDLSATYDRVLAYFDTLPKDRSIAFNLVCQIDDPSTARQIPANYPPVTHLNAPSKQEWFEKLVDWWQLQRPTIGKTLHFTHGKRIRAFEAPTGINEFGATDATIDQLDNVIKLFGKRPDSTRGIVTLLSPITDPVHKQNRKFPSFCLVQFLIRKVANGNPKFDCIAFFRKQEMKYWWPINIAELSSLQRRVYDNIPKEGEQEGLELGSITTFSAMAKLGTSAPQALVPAIDRALDESREALWAMVYALFWQEMPDRERHLTEWKKVLSELLPEQNFNIDGVPVPISGLNYLIETTRKFAAHHASEEANNLVDAMENLRDCNQLYIDDIYSESADANRHADWQQTAKKHVEKMRVAFDKLVAITQE